MMLYLMKRLWRRVFDWFILTAMKKTHVGSLGITGEELQLKHLRAFSRMRLSARLDLSFEHGRFLRSLLDEPARSLNKQLRMYGRRYFKNPHLA